MNSNRYQIGKFYLDRKIIDYNALTHHYLSIIYVHLHKKALPRRTEDSPTPKSVTDDELNKETIFCCLANKDIR